MLPYTLLTVVRQVDQIREGIRLHGFFVASCEDLAFLSEGRASEKERTTSLKQIGQWEKWAVETQPYGKVRFSTLAATANGSSIPRRALTAFKKASAKGRLLITKLISVIILGAALSFQTGCAKSDSARIAEIDVELANMTSSGSIEDADKRSALVSERARLRKSSGFQVQTAQVQPKYSQPAVPPARATANTTVIATDSRLQGQTPMRSTWDSNINNHGGRIYATPSQRRYYVPSSRKYTTPPPP